MAKASRKKGKAAQPKEAEKSVPKPPFSETVREYLVAILVCLVIALFVVTFIAHPMAVPTPSMDTPPERKIPGTNETLGDYNLLVGDRLIVDKLTILANHFPLTRFLKLNHPIRRGEVVVFKAPDRKEGHYLIPYVKRVIGLPGETIEIRQNQVFINGCKLIEPYKYHGLGVENPTPYAYMPPLRIPDDHYFMMGDNRDFSSDSRDWGTVPADFIFGKPLFILWSFPDNALLQKVFPDQRYRGVHEVNAPLDILQLYLFRLIYFYQTRWGRMFHFIPRGMYSFEGAPAPGLPMPA
jgi:signal peptidase I